MGRSSKPDCKLRIPGEKENTVKEHSWGSKSKVKRVYAKIDGMKSVPYWICLSCGNILDNDGIPLSRSDEKVRSEELEEIGLKEPKGWSILTTSFSHKV